MSPSGVLPGVRCLVALSESQAAFKREQAAPSVFNAVEVLAAWLGEQHADTTGRYLPPGPEPRCPATPSGTWSPGTPTPRRGPAPLWHQPMTNKSSSP